MGSYFSFNGSFLEERHAARRTVFASLPVDRILVETDAPAMPPPEKFRPYSLPGLADGSVLNHPGNITGVYAGLAGIRGTTVEALAAEVEKNFRRLFG
jgi:TatD DNase family protein